MKMNYISTRGGGQPKQFLDILLEGLAPDGGLYVPEEYPRVSDSELTAMRAMSYPELAFAILSKFIDDIPAEHLRELVNATYTKETFGSEEIVPIKKLEDGLYILGLSEGPTLAFKDIALQLLGRLFEYALKKRGGVLNIVGATSGDTGSAAEYAMRGRAGIKVFMLSPHGRMSEFQRKQMYTLADPNIFNIAVRSTFDDCQDIVKALNEDATFKKKYSLGAVNSINWGRIAAQTVYYFWAYFRSTSLTAGRITKSNSERVSFSVPTGNFGDILAGYIAKRMGVPVEQLILATNENNVLEEFFATGTYRPRTEVAATSSPSMDIAKASNFERYIFELALRDAARMRELWTDLKNSGKFSVSRAELERAREGGFIAGSSTHADRVATIRSIYKTYGVLIDPHTADGVTTGLKYREKNVPLICLETAQPAKFAETIREAVGVEPPVPAVYKQLGALPEHCNILNAGTAEVKRYITTHA